MSNGALQVKRNCPVATSSTTYYWVLCSFLTKWVGIIRPGKSEIRSVCVLQASGWPEKKHVATLISVRLEPILTP